MSGLVSSMVGREISDDWIDLAPSARFGFEPALWGLCAASSARRSLLEVVARHRAATVPVNALIDGTPDKVLEEARRARSAGYEAVKLKVGGRAVEEDAELVHALNEVLGDAVALRLDANRAWSFDEAQRFVRGTAGLRFEYVEEPLADPALLPAFARDHGAPVALDTYRRLAGDVLRPPLELRKLARTRREIDRRLLNSIG